MMQFCGMHRQDEKLSLESNKQGVISILAQMEFYPSNISQPQAGMHPVLTASVPWT